MSLLRIVASSLCFLCARNPLAPKALFTAFLLVVLSPNLLHAQSTNTVEFIIDQTTDGVQESTDHASITVHPLGETPIPYQTPGLTVDKFSRWTETIEIPFGASINYTSARERRGIKTSESIEDVATPSGPTQIATTTDDNWQKNMWSTKTFRQKRQLDFDTGECPNLELKTIWFKDTPSSRETIYLENFENYPNEYGYSNTTLTSALGLDGLNYTYPDHFNSFFSFNSNTWTIDIPSNATANRFQIRNQEGTICNNECQHNKVFHAQRTFIDGNDGLAGASWISHPIDVSDYTALELTWDYDSGGDLDGCGTGDQTCDWMRLYVKTDGGQWEEYWELTGHHEQLSAADNTISGPSAIDGLDDCTTIQFKIATRTTGNEETYQFDNIKLTGIPQQYIWTFDPITESGEPTPDPVDYEYPRLVSKMQDINIGIIFDSEDMDIECNHQDVADKPMTRIIRRWNNNASNTTGSNYSFWGTDACTFGTCTTPDNLPATSATFLADQIGLLSNPNRWPSDLFGDDVTRNGITDPPRLSDIGIKARSGKDGTAYAGLSYKVNSTTGEAKRTIDVTTAGVVGITTDLYATFTLDGDEPSTCEIFVESPDGTIHKVITKDSNEWANGEQEVDLSTWFTSETAPGEWAAYAQDLQAGGQHRFESFVIRAERAPVATWTATSGDIDVSDDVGKNVYLSSVSITSNVPDGSTAILNINDNSGSNYSFELGTLGNNSLAQQEDTWSINNGIWNEDSIPSLSSGATWSVIISNPKWAYSQDRTIQNVEFVFAGLPTSELGGTTLDACASTIGANDRPFSFRVFPSHITPDGCDDQNNQLFYHKTGNDDPIVEHNLLIKRVPDNLTPGSPSTPGVRYVSSGSVKIFDVYDAANDLHYTALRLNDNAEKGESLYRPQITGQHDHIESPLLVATQMIYATDELKDAGSHEVIPTATGLSPVIVGTHSDGYPDSEHASNNDSRPLVHLMSTSNVNDHILSNSGETLSFEEDEEDWQEWFVLAPDNIPNHLLIPDTNDQDVMDEYEDWTWLKRYQWAGNSQTGLNVSDMSWQLYPLTLDNFDPTTIQSLGATEIELNLTPESAEISALDLNGSNLNVWNANADVQLFSTTELKTRLEGTFDNGVLHVSMPITAPVYSLDDLDNLPQDGSDAVKEGLPYWGFPNGVSGSADMWVRVTSHTDPTKQYTLTVNSNDTPLMRKDCPFLVQDSLRIEIPASALEASGFFGGDELDIQCMALWATDARRTALWSDASAETRVILCDDINLDLALEPLDTTRNEASNKASATIRWNVDTLKTSSGGFIRLQRRNGTDEDEWQYFKNVPLADMDVLTADAGTSSFLTSDRDQAKTWFNRDDNGDLQPDAVTFTDPTLWDDLWQCQTVEYRLEQEMCDEIYHSPVQSINLLGQLENPWKVDGLLSTGIETSHGDFPFKVRVDWATATDQNDVIDQFRVYRRPYTPAEPNDQAWDQIFSSEDFTWFIDQDIAAGVLYEYRVGAIVNCSTGDTPAETTVQIQEFFPPEPYNIGFRSSSGGVSGEVLYEDGSPSGNAVINASEQSSVGARNSLALSESEYIKLDLTNIPGHSTSVWPDISSADPNEEWTISQWVQVPNESFDIPAIPEVPIVAYNFTKPTTGALNEAFSLWAKRNSPEDSEAELFIKLGGTPLPPFNANLGIDQFNHISLTLSTSVDSIMTIKAIVQADDLTTPLDSSSVTLNFESDQLGEILQNWTSIYWNAASYSEPECSDPYADNFAPLATSSSQSPCLYGSIGCSDPEFNSSTPANFDANMADQGASCDYSDVQSSELISIRWFNDNTNNVLEVPVIYKITASDTSIAHTFRPDAFTHYENHLAAGTPIAYSMPVFTTKLAPGDYLVRVIDFNLPGSSSITPTISSNFSGNFSIHNDRGVEYVNCIQYVPSEESSQAYDFSITEDGCIAAYNPTPSGTGTVLLTDCASCYSISYSGGSSTDLNLTPSGTAYIGNTPTVSTWFRAPDASGTGDILKLTSSGSTLTLAAAPSTNPDNLGGVKFKLTGPDGPLSREPAAPYNEFNLVPGQWYHAILHVGTSGSGHFTLRSTDINDEDFEPWNSTRHFDFASTEVISPIATNGTGFQIEGITIGGSDVVIHKLSIWKASLDDTQSLALFNKNLDGLPTADLVSVLAPDNSGRFIDNNSGNQFDLDLQLFDLQLFSEGTAPLLHGSPLGTVQTGIHSIRRAPWGSCTRGCARVHNACNFNPLADIHEDCQLGCAGITTTANIIASYPANYDEIRGWTKADYWVLDEDIRINQSDNDLHHVDYMSWEMASHWHQRYPGFLTDGLFLMYDADEGLGNVLYDRSQFGADGWNHNDAFVRKQVEIDNTAGGYDYIQTDAPPSGMYYSDTIPKNKPTTLSNWTTSSEINGLYIIDNIKYKGSSSLFDVNIAKQTGQYPHEFSPSQQTALIGDMMLANENRDFTDVSAFDVEIQVVYQDIQTEHEDFSGTNDPIPSSCPVEGVQFRVNGTTVNDEAGQPKETDADGRVTLSLPRGEAFIIPTLNAGTDNAHIFDLPSADGKQIMVTGPTDAPIVFVDKTTRRAVGRVIGGLNQAAMAWDASHNNLGKTRIQLVQEYPDEASSNAILAHQCPTVILETDDLGQYDVQLLPAHYRIAHNSDFNTSQDNFDNEKLDYQQIVSMSTWPINVEGWKHTPPDWYDEAFPQHTKDLGEGDLEYARWDMTDALNWSQEEEYPDATSNSGPFHPEDAFARVDLVYRASPELTVRQTQFIPDGDSGTCDPSNSSALIPELGNTFLGDTLLIVGPQGSQYASPLQTHLKAHYQSWSDPDLTPADQANYAAVPPFPVGLPTIHSETPYCSRIDAIEKYGCTYDNEGTQYDFDETIPVVDSQYEIKITNTLSNPQDNLSIPLDSDGGTTYQFLGALPAYDASESTPLGHLVIQLYKGPNVQDNWQPFSHLFQSSDYSGIPMLMTEIGTTNPLLDPNKFTAIILGSRVASTPIPISTDPALDFVLRDPPGDQSFCSLAQGSTFSFEKTFETGNEHTKTRESNYEYVPTINYESETLLAPLGFGIGSGAEVEIDVVTGVTTTEEYSKDLGGSTTISEEMTITQAISTSPDEQNFLAGINQDIFYGTVRNYETVVMQHHKLDPYSPNTAPTTLAEIGIQVDNAPVAKYQDFDDDGIIDLPLFFGYDATTGTFDYNDLQYQQLDWIDVPSMTMLPASHFMKTAYAIETVDIPLLEAKRDHYFKYSGFYEYPDGQASNTIEDELGWSYPDGMKYANNDDHRWELFHQTWMDERNAASTGFPTQASTLQQGYAVLNEQVISLVDPDWTLSTTLPTTSDGYDAALINRLAQDAQTGDDRVGPGYRFSVTPAQLAAAQPADGSTITDIQLDSVRYYNAKINQWKLLLAENEFEKLNARKYISANIENQFADPANLSTWIEDMENSGEAIQEWNLDDFSDILDDDGNIADNTLLEDQSIWDDADFQPFFLNFSGGGSEFTQTLSKTNITEQSRTMTLSGNWGEASNAGLTIGGAGIITSYSQSQVVTESRSNTQGTESNVTYEYTLSDDDEGDFYLVCVVPGKGMNGPIFLNLGSATACPWVPQEDSKYSEWYAALIPTPYNIISDITNCTEINKPVWDVSIPSGEIQFIEGGEAFHYASADFVMSDDHVIMSGPDHNALNAALIAGAGGVAGIAAAAGAFTTSAAVLAGAAGFMAAGVFDAITYKVWRDNTWNEYSDIIETLGYTEETWSEINAALIPSELFIAPGMCDEITEPDPEIRAENTIIQPQSTAMEGAKLRIQIDGGSYTDLDTIAPMDVPIALTLELENTTPPIYGGSSDYLLYADITENTLGASVSIGGGSSSSIDYHLQPSWSHGKYYVDVVIEQNGVEENEFLDGHVELVLQSSCDIRIQDRVRINLTFEPACSDLELLIPGGGTSLDGNGTGYAWEGNLNTINSGSLSITDSLLPMEVDLTKNNFTNWATPPVVLEYRTDTDTEWKPLYPEDPASVPNYLPGSGLPLQNFTFDWRPQNAQSMFEGFEGEVYLRAQSSCVSPWALPKFSPLLTGKVDYIRPKPFGATLPADGFYEIGDELMLRWSESMDIHGVAAGSGGDITMTAEENGDFAKNSGGVQFSGAEHIAIPQASNLDAHGWSASWSWYTTIDQATVEPGVVFCQGNHNEASLTVELIDLSSIAVIFRANGQVVDADTLDLTSWSGDDWTRTDLFFNRTEAQDTYTIGLHHNGGVTLQTGSISIPTFNLPSRRLTIGNGWNGGATGNALDLPLQDFRIWSSQRNTFLSGNPGIAGNSPGYTLTGNEVGLQVYLPLDELEGTPAEEARHRTVFMNANWMVPGEASCLDFSDNPGTWRPSLPAFSASSAANPNMTLEFWMKPGATEEGILTSGNANPEIDLAMANWSFEVDASGKLIVANGPDTLKTPTSLTDAWHHIALSRSLNGTVNLYLDGDLTSTSPSHLHGPFFPQSVTLGARATGTTSYDRPFTGKLDEIRVWSTALPLETIRKRMRDGVHGYDNLVLHAPFDVRDTVQSNEVYLYGIWTGYDYNNDDTSLDMPDEFTLEDVAALPTDPTDIIVSGDAPLIQNSPTQTASTSGTASITWNSLHDEMIIELDEETLYKYEDLLVTFSIPAENLKDEALNTIEADFTFDMRIDRNPLKWTDSELHWSGNPNDPAELTTSIQNIGFQNEYFEIAGLPSWIEASPSSGTIGSTEEVDITFHITDERQIGWYEVDAMLKGGIPCGSNSSGGFCFGERMTMTFDMHIEGPEFFVDANQFANSMDIIAKVYKGDIASSNDRDIVMAYVDGELRGYAQLDMVISDQNLAFLSIFYNHDVDGGKLIDFRVWDASSGVIRALVETRWPSLETSPGPVGLPGSIDDTPNYSVFEPLLLMTSDKVEVQTELEPGWNWVGINVTNEPATLVAEAFAALPESDIVQIKAHGIVNGIYFQNDDWTPNQGHALDVTTRYEVQMKEGVADSWTLSNIGTAAHPDDHFKALYTGWNELGYLPHQEFSVEDALISLADADTILGFNDLFKSRYEGFAVHTGDGQWAGSLTTLRPGQGYRLFLDDADGAGSFVGELEWPVSHSLFNPGFRSYTKSRNGVVSFEDVNEQDDVAWTMNVRSLPSSMSMIIRLETSSSLPQGLTDILGAFAVGTDGVERCVGQATPMDTEEGLLYFLSVYGNEATPSELTFKWKSGISGMEFDADDVMSFAAASLKGSLTEPVLLHFNRSDMETVLSDGGLTAYPNPFDQHLTVHWNGDLPILSLVVEDVNGRLIDRLDCDPVAGGPCRWMTSSLESGVYFIRATTEEGQRVVRVVK